MDGASLSQTGREDKGGIANDTIYLYLKGRQIEEWLTCLAIGLCFGVSVSVYACV